MSFLPTNNFKSYFIEFLSTESFLDKKFNLLNNRYVKSVQSNALNFCPHSLVLSNI